MQNIQIGASSFQVHSDDTYLSAMGSVFEPPMVALFQALIQPQDVVADIGANIGLTALLFSTLARETYAFEPSPSTFALLQANLTRNGVGNVKAINLGLGEKADRLSLTYAANNRSGGYVSEKTQVGAGHITESIAIGRLSDVFAEHKIAPNFLKLDVEGFEMSVIKGGLDYIKTHQPLVVMELNHFCLNVLQRIALPDFLDFMRGVFPHLYAVDGDNSSIADLHHPDAAYGVMHAHVVSHRYPNIVGGFNPEFVKNLKALVEASRPLPAPTAALEPIPEPVPKPLPAPEQAQEPSQFPAIEVQPSLKDRLKQRLRALL